MQRNNLMAKSMITVLLTSLFACGGGGDSSGNKSVVGDPTLPVKVEIVSRLNVTDITINWVDRTDNEDGFYVERKIEDQEFKLIATLPADSLRYIDKKINAEKTYCYRISAYNQVGRAEAETQCQFVPSVIK